MGFISGRSLWHTFISRQYLSFIPSIPIIYSEDLLKYSFSKRSYFQHINFLNTVKSVRCTIDLNTVKLRSMGEHSVETDRPITHSLPYFQHRSIGKQFDPNEKTRNSVCHPTLTLWMLGNFLKIDYIVVCLLKPVNSACFLWVMIDWVANRLDLRPAAELLGGWPEI